MSVRSALRAFVFRFKDGLVYVVPAAVLSGVLALAFGVGALRDALDGSLFQDLRLEYPVYADLDAKDDLFVIDKNSRRIVSLTADGTTLEDVVRELLKPLLKSWLDEHLRAIVEAKVEEEVERVRRRQVG